MKNNSSNCKARIDYPCQWLYKVIGKDQEELQAAFAEIAGHKSCNISHSNTSSKGKYLCLNLELTVESEEERNEIYLALKSHPSIKIVL